MEIKKLVAKAALLGVVAMMLPQTSMAASATGRTISTDNHTKSTANASYDLSFNLPSTVTNSQTFTLTWPAGYNISSVTSSDVDVENTTDTVDYTVAATSANGQWGFGVSGQVMTLTAPADISTVNTLESSEDVHIEIGPNTAMGAAGASNGVTQPSTAGSYNISLGGTASITGGFAIAIVDDSTVDVTATVTETITLALSATDLTFGTMSTGAEAFDSFTATVNTNADSGYTLRYTSTALANPNGTALASATTATATAAGTEGWGINGVLNSSPSVGGAKTETNGSGAVSAPYTTADSVAVTTTGAPSTFATSATTAEDEVYTVSGIANISAITEAGDYTGTMALLVQATF